MTTPGERYPANNTIDQPSGSLTEDPNMREGEQQGDGDGQQHIQARKLSILEKSTVLCIYPITMLLGQLVSISNRQESYFSNKRNFFNVVFVRQGWFWTTLAFLALAFHTQKNTGSRANRQVELRQQFARYVVATIWWLLFSQWCFGLPLMDRVFLLTGGTCEGAMGVSEALVAANGVSSAMCRSHGGAWTGGYDPSGHSFLLAHSSLFLWFEMLPILQRELRQGAKSISLAVKFTLVILVLWWWMLLMTSIYFHSFVEKLAGLFWGILEIIAVYVYSKQVSGLKELFGSP